MPAMAYPIPRSSLILAFCAFWTFLASIPGGEAFPAEPQLAEISDQLKAWRDSFASIRVVWHAWNRADALAADPQLDSQLEFDGHTYHAEEFVWADWGAIRWELKSFKSGDAVYRTLMGTDGVQPWEADSALGHGTAIATIKLVVPNRDRPLFSRVAMSALAGMWRSAEGKWFDEALAEGSVLRSEDVDGHQCAVVRVARADSSVEDTYWLDEDFGFLPRRYQQTGRQADGGAPQLWYEWTVNDTQVSPDGLAFPARGTFRNGTEKPPGTEWIIKSILINESLGRTDFAPPPGGNHTRVIDYVNRRTSSVEGSDAASPDAASSEGSPLSPVAAPIVAVPATFRWELVGVAGCVLLVLGVYLRWRKRGSV